MIDPTWHIRRHELGKSDRDQLAYIWRDCYAFTYPIRGSRWFHQGTRPTDKGVTEAGTGLAQQIVLQDDTGTDSARILASALKDGGMPSTSQWFELEVGGADAPGRRWLESASEETWKLIHNSNFDAVGFEALIDYVCGGQAVLFVDSDREEGGLVFEQWDFAECTFLASRRGGPIDTIYREFTMTAEQADGEYPGRVSSATLEKARQRPSDLVTFLWCIYPRSGTPGPFALSMAWASVVIEVETRTVVKESGFVDFPCVVPRWMLIPSSPYAVGPTYEALPGMRQLNRTIDLQLMGLEIHAGAGTYKAIDDGVLNPRTIRLGNRRVIIVGEIDNLQPLAKAGNLQDTLLDIERLQRQIRRTMMADALEPAEGGQRTATEVQVRVELLRQQLGPMYGRQQAELHAAIINRCFGLALRAGALGAPPSSINQQFSKIKFTSPLARAQQLPEVTAIDRYVQGTLIDMQLDPTVVDRINVHVANRIRAERLGVPSEAVRDDNEVEAIQRQRQQAEARQEAEQAALMASQAVDNQQPATAAAAAAIGGARAQ